MGAVHPSFGALGVLAGGGLIYAGGVSNPIFYLILGTGAYSSGRRLLGYEDEVRPDELRSNELIVSTY